MKREKQVELIQSAETRTAGYLQKWLSNPAFKAAVERQDRVETEDDNETHYRTRVRKRACA